MTANWSELLPELIIAICKEVTYYEDLLSIADVSTPWKTAADFVRQRFTGPCQLPCLILPEKKGEVETGENHGNLRKDLFFLRSGETSGVMLPAEVRKRRLIPTSQGWLLTYDKDARIVPTLWHPFSGRQIDLPKINTFPGYVPKDNKYMHHIKKAVLSSTDPSSPNFLVMVIYDGTHRLGFCRPGDLSWTSAETDYGLSFFDFCYHNGHLYAMNFFLDMYVWDVHSPNPTKLQLIKRCPRKHIPTGSAYLIKSGLDDDTFLAVIREYQTYYKGIDALDTDTEFDKYVDEEYDPDEMFKDEDDSDSDEEDDPSEIDVDEDDNEVDEDDDPSEIIGDADDLEEVDEESEYEENKKFRVFEFSLNDANRWEELDNLGGNRALFVGYNSSFSIKANAGGIIKPDCLYFTDDDVERYLYTRKGGGMDMGIYHLRDGTLEPHFNLWRSRCHINPPSWVFCQTSV